MKLSQLFCNQVDSSIVLQQRYHTIAILVASKLPQFRWCVAPWGDMNLLYSTMSNFLSCVLGTRPRKISQNRAEPFPTRHLQCTVSQYQYNTLHTRAADKILHTENCEIYWLPGPVCSRSILHITVKILYNSQTKYITIFQQ